MSAGVSAPQHHVRAASTAPTLSTGDAGKVQKFSLDPEPELDRVHRAGGAEPSDGLTLLTPTLSPDAKRREANKRERMLS